MFLKTFRRVLALAGKFRWRIKTAFVCAVFESILSKMPIMVAFLVLTGFYEGTLEPVGCLYVGIALVVIVIAQVIFHFVNDYLQSAAGYMMFCEERLKLGNHLRKLPMGYFTAGNIGKISSVLSTDMVFIEEVAMTTIANMMSYVLTAAVMVVFMLILSPQLGLIALITTIIVAIVSEKMNQMAALESAIRQDQSEHLTDAVLSFTEGIGVIKSYNLIGEKSQELTNNFVLSKDTSITFERKVLPWQRALLIICAVGITAVFSTAVYLYNNDLLSASYVLGVLLFVFDLFGPLKALFGESSRLTVMNAALDRIEEVLNEVELPDNGKNKIPEECADAPEISFNDVSFAYQEEETISNISFEISKNTMLALVGPSGGGKSTIANLLARFWDIKSGAVKIRGVDVADVPLANLMEQISMVFQRVYLFQDTIYNNIVMGRPDATEEAVFEAAKKARCYEFIMALPEGFQTMVGEGGATLSGGEKQRISIARCILKDSPIVILDEATASVDADNESYIQDAISELIKGKTLLVIAHRLNTIRFADKILVISNGRIVQSGTHEQLIAEQGVYKNLIEIGSQG